MNGIYNGKDVLVCLCVCMPSCLYALMFLYPHVCMPSCTKTL